MQKILLVGELNDIVRSLNDCLSKEYQVQLCPEQTKSVQAMIRIIRPDLVIICQIGVKEIDVAVFELLQDKYPNTPVLGIATSEGWKQCRNFYKKKQFNILFRPVENIELLGKCRRLLPSEENKEEMETHKKNKDLWRRKRILVVDDSALLLRSMKNMLEKYYDISLAKSGEQALKMIPKVNPDLVLLDYEMQGMDGRDTFEAMKDDEEMQEIPVVFLTSVSDADSIYSILKMEPEGYILKPPDEKRIREKIEEIFLK